MSVSERFFVHYAAHGDFESGLFMPFGTQEEAELQVAADLANGADPEFIERIFSADYLIPKFGWTRTEMESGEPHHHLVERNQTKVATRKQILTRTNKHQQRLLDDVVKGTQDNILAIDKLMKEGRLYKNAVPGNAYSVMTGGTATAGAAALAAATAKTLCMITAAAANQPAVIEIGISFDGVTASAVPVLVELVSGTATTTGTVVAQTPKQERGWPAQTAQTTGQITISAEPTVQLVNRKYLVTPNGGLLVIQLPMGREPTGIVTATTDGKTWSLRATAPAIVNAHAYMLFEE